jgi:hypothetical protein
MILEEIEAHGLQFYLSKECRFVYLEFLKERKKRNERKKKHQEDQRISFEEG